MYKINFNHLYYFLTIAEEGTIVKASKKLHITQPALSHQLKILEQDLGKQLFDRKGRRLSLSKDGEAVLSYANNIFRQSEELINMLKGRENRSVTIVKIGTVAWISQEVIHSFLKPLLANPFFRVQLVQGDLSYLNRQLKDKKLDLLLTDSLMTRKSKKIMSYRISSTPILCVAPMNFMSQKKIQFPKCLEGQKILHYSEASNLRGIVDGFLETLDFDPLITGEFNDTNFISYCVKKGTGIGFLPEVIAKESIRKKEVKKIGVIEREEFVVNALVQKDSPLLSTIKKLLLKRRI